MPIVTLAEMRRALANTLGKRCMPPEEVARLANQIMSYFGFDDFVIDNRLSSEERNMFYMLEEEGFLTTQQDEVVVAKGKTWRIHYWILRHDNIKRLAEETEPKHERETEFYEDLDDDAWVRGFDPPKFK